MVDLYVYYKVRAVDAAQLAPLVRAMQAGLIARQRVQAQLKRRPEARDGLQTWMEIYLDVAPAFEAILAQAALDAGLAPLTQGPRRSEIFVDLPPCA